MLLAIAAAGAYALAAYGRRATLGELGGDPFAVKVADALTFTDALGAGARALAGKNPLPTAGQVTITDR